MHLKMIESVAADLVSLDFILLPLVSRMGYNYCGLIFFIEFVFVVPFSLI